MFYLVRSLVTELSFPHSQMHKIGNEDYILNALRFKMLGKFFHEYGVIVQIPDFQKRQKAIHENQQEESPFSLPTIDDNNCRLNVKFRAICFKVEKNDIFDILVKEIDEEGITGQLGIVQVKIPVVKMDSQLHYDSITNSYRLNHQMNAIDVGKKVRCKCFQVSSFMGIQMRVLASLPSSLLKFISSDVIYL